jgi:hypothetical protein
MAKDGLKLLANWYYLRVGSTLQFIAISNRMTSEICSKISDHMLYILKFKETETSSQFIFKVMQYLLLVSYQ